MSCCNHRTSFTIIDNAMYSDKALGEFDSNTRSLFVESLWHRKLAHMDSERINKTAQLNKEIIPIRNIQVVY